jgi:hypothetical protein
MGKFASPLAPLKPITIPRLELQAAVVSAKISRLLNSELDHPEIKNNYWTDSKAVLGYVNNDARRFHTFVANRIQVIKQYSKSEECNNRQSSGSCL